MLSYRLHYNEQVSKSMDRTSMLVVKRTDAAELSGAEEAMQRENRRVRLTKRLLKEALVQLLGEKDIEKITVSELCRVAEVSRSTFYIHYASGYDVLRDVEGDLLAGMKSELEKVPEDAGWTLGEQVCQMCRYLEKHREVARQVFRVSTPHSDFSSDLLRMRIAMQPERYAFLREGSREEAGMVSAFLAAGGFEVIRRWVLGEWDASPEEVGRLVDRVVGAL